MAALLTMAVVLFWPAWATGTAVDGGADVMHIRSATRFAGDISDGSGVPVPLPDPWNGQGRSGVWSYDLEFTLTAKPDELWSAYIPRIGNRFRVSLNGHTIAQQGGLDDTAADYVQHAQLVALFARDLRVGANTLRLTVAGERARYAGLSPVQVGPSAALAPLLQRRLLLQNWGAFGVVILASLLALVAGSIAQVLRDRALTIFTLACVFTVVRNLYTVVIHAPVDYRLWAWITDMSYAAVVICLALFSMAVVRLPERLLKPLLLAFSVASVLLVSIYAFGRHAGARQLWLALQLLVAMTANACLLVAWWRQRTRAATILGLAALVSVGFGAYDHISVFYLKDGYSSFALSRYVLPLFTLAMAAVLVDRFGQYTRREIQLRQDLADELFSKTRQLEDEFSRHQTVAAMLAKVHERERLIQDLHDGMGMQLQGILGLVERDQPNRPELTIEVRTAIEQMRSLVDSAEPFEGDVQQLFGHIRYRVEGRLRRLGIELAWRTELPDDNARVSPASASALQQLLFELVTNALKHAHARQIRVRALHHPTDDMLQILFEDDGIGFIADQVVSGGGSRSLMRRTRELNAQMAVLSSPGGGTAVTIEIPYASMVSPRPAPAGTTAIRPMKPD